MDIHLSTDRKNMIGHSLFISKFKNQAYVEDDNEILVEDDIVKAMIFNGGISGTIDVLFGAANISGKRYLNKIKLKP